MQAYQIVAKCTRLTVIEASNYRVIVHVTATRELARQRCGDIVVRGVVAFAMCAWLVVSYEAPVHVPSDKIERLDCPRCCGS